MAAADAARKAGFLAVMSEDFPAKDARPLDECLTKVAKADLVVAIVAHRYGWVPNDPLNQDNKSITWLECERAAKEGKDVLAFLLDDEGLEQPWFRGR